MKKINLENIEDNERLLTVSFLEGLTEKIIDATHTVDTHANVMIGINTGIFIFVISKLFEYESLKITMGVVALFSACSVIAAMLAIRLPRVITKRYAHEESVLHAPRISKFKSANEYAITLKKMLKNEDEMLKQHSLEAFNLSKYYYAPKRRMLAWSRYFFLFGVMASALFLLMEKLHWFIF
jgi:hypothetical protein